LKYVQYPNHVALIGPCPPQSHDADYFTTVSAWFFDLNRSDNVTFRMSWNIG